MDPPLTRPLRSSPDWCQCPGGDGVRRPRAADRPPPVAHPLPKLLSTGGRLPANVLRTLRLSVSQQTDTNGFIHGSRAAAGHVPRAHIYSTVRPHGGRVGLLCPAVGE